MTKILVLINKWLQTMSDKSQAKLDVQSILQWMTTWNAQNELFIAGKEQLPSLPAAVAQIDWCKQLYSYLTSLIAMQPDEFKGACANIIIDLQKSVKDITAEIGTMVTPPEGATPSQTAALACLAAMKALGKLKPNFPEIQEMMGHVNECIPSINKIPAEAVALANKAAGTSTAAATASGEAE